MTIDCLHEQSEHIMNKFIAKTLEGDKVVWIIFALLFLISLLEMFSASSRLVYWSSSVQGPILRHVIFFAVGFVALLLVQLLSFRAIRRWGYFILFCSWILLMYTTLRGIEQAGAARWISIAGFKFQPSEPAKLSLVVVIADLVERMQNIERQNKLFWIVMGGVVFTCAMIFTENFSTAVLLFGIVIIMMFIGEMQWRKILTACAGVVGIIAIILAMAWFIPDDVYYSSESPVLKKLERSKTWVARIQNFANDENVSKYKINDSNYQANHAQMAIARGGFIPKGPGSSVERNYLPEAFSDFIFAIIVEELSFFMGIFVMFLYLWLLFRAGRVAQQSDSLFCALLVIGVTLVIVLQAFIHIAVSVHLIPVTGQPLPLISRGGTSLLFNCIYFGLIIRVTKHIQLQKKLKQSVESTSESSSVQTAELVEMAN